MIANTHSIDSLRELNARLLAEIAELRKENAEIKVENTELKDKNAEIPDLKRKFTEIESEKVELKARIVELLRQAVEESKWRDAENAKLKNRIEELESENVEFRDRIMKVEQRQMQNDQKGINSSNNSSSNFNSVADQVSKANTHHGKLLVDTSLPEKLIPEGLPEVTVSAVNIPVMDQCHQTSLENKETDAFLDEVHKKKVSNEIKQRKQEKKLNQSHVLFQDSSSTTSESFHHEADLSMTNTKHALPEQVVKESTPKESSLVLMEPQKIEKKQVNLSEIKVAKISYNQKVEQDLICELLEFIRCHGSTSSPNSISSKHIPDVPIGADLTPGSVPHLVHLFDKAEKTGWKEKLRWYYYSEEYEKKVVALISENNISDQMARTQIYDEMEPYLPSKKREYLRKMTQKAKNIYTLFKGIGIDKIGVVTSSADAISRLTDAQIQNTLAIINNAK
ncbi:7856_t:CDS:1 [Cetraspora pellucida]|uniref:7856_t:CDS:1 n=1 Tax=Cetraspora pellucida TaxID=1433469 RepID=A0ACA9LRQ3_9GLOM|nr:7856_t:CDS:1 [Cetraspora pellucida]